MQPAGRGEDEHAATAAANARGFENNTTRRLSASAQTLNEICAASVHDLFITA
jgi:hypothetical protein